MFGDVIVPFVFGAEWITSGEYVQILTPWLFLVFITSPISKLFLVLEKQKESLYFNILLFILRLTSLFIGGVMFKDAKMAIILFGLSGFVFWFFFSGYVLKLAAVPIWRAFRFVLINIIIIGLPVWLVRFVIDIL